MMFSFINRDRKIIIAWLIICMALMALMVLIGGYTRLSGSGLSITEWKPIHGVIPPMGVHEWEEEFEAYKQSPQYQKINQGMSLEEFQKIYWPEYLHRLLGRLIGAVFFLPLVIFTLRHSFTARFGWRLAGIFVLGSLQGLMGWLMVASGLVDNPHVSHLRLAAHLALAFAIFGLLLWAFLDASSQLPVVRKKGHSLLITGNWQLTTYFLWFTLLCLQLILGAFVAGLHGGLIYNTWPTMNGRWLPDGLLAVPWIENITLIQFMHRKLAVLLAAGFLFWWYFNRAHVTKNHLGKACVGVASIIAFQFVLGVLTLLHSVPLPLAMAHQMTALALFGMAVWLLHVILRRA